MSTATTAAAQPGTAQTTAVPGKATPPPLAHSMATTTGSLMLVLLVIVGLGWLLRRLQGLRPSGGAVIKLLASQSVGHKERVVLVQLADTQLLLGVSAGQVNLLHRMDRPLDEAAPEPAAASAGPGEFAARLQHWLKKEPQ
jgi:flagellar protein FliO/FliZ